MTKAHRRELIVDAARGLLSERAYDDIAIGDIAAEAGVTRTVLYDHFPSKQALVLSFLADEVAALVDILADRIRSSTGSVSDRITAVVDAHFEFIETRPLAFRMMALDSRTDAEIAVAGQRLREAGNQALAAALATDFERVGIVPGSLAAQANIVLLTSAIQGITSWWFEHQDVPRDQIVEATVQCLCHGLNSPLGSENPSDRPARVH